jgi:hypothetical protein
VDGDERRSRSSVRTTFGVTHNGDRNAKEARISTAHGATQTYEPNLRFFAFVRQMRIYISIMANRELDVREAEATRNLNVRGGETTDNSVLG